MAKYRYSKSSSPFDEVKNMYILIGICAVAVIIALVLCLALQRGSDEPDIPVVEQGDGVGETVNDIGGTENIGDVIVDDGNTPVEEFVVTVTGADGVYQRDDSTSLTISGQNSYSFSFALTTSGGSMNGTAYFIGERSAVCEKSEGSLVFDFEADAVDVVVNGSVSELSGSTADGLYILIEASPTTSSETTQTTTGTTQAAQNGSAVYDLDAIRSAEVQSALSDMMPAADYSLITELLDSCGGYGMIYGTGDSSKEKQGRQFNYDFQMDAVMYFAFESGTGREIVVLCASDGMVYAGVCDGSEYRYYTNDPSRTGVDDAPNYIEQYARIKGMSLI